jgi:hypothetical protein
MAKPVSGEGPICYCPRFQKVELQSANGAAHHPWQDIAAHHGWVSSGETPERSETAKAPQQPEGFPRRSDQGDPTELNVGSTAPSTSPQFRWLSEQGRA